MMSKSQQVIDTIVGMIFDEAVKYGVAPDAVMRKVRESLDNKMISIRAANPVNVADMAQMIHQQLVTRPYINCKCSVHPLGEWGAAISPRKIIYSGNRTVVFWNDGTKTIVKCAQGEVFSEYIGFIAAYAKKMFRSTSGLKKMIKTISSYDKSGERYAKKMRKKAHNSDEAKD